MVKLVKKLAILSKQLNRELVCNKKYLASEKKSAQKKVFVVFVNE